MLTEQCAERLCTALNIHYSNLKVYNIVPDLFKQAEKQPIEKIISPTGYISYTGGCSHSEETYVDCIFVRNIKGIRFVTFYNVVFNKPSIACADKYSFKLLMSLSRLHRQAIKEETLGNIIIDKNLWDSIIDNTIGFINRAKMHSELYSYLSHGLVLYGKPGNGKSLIVSKIMAICNYKHISVASFDTAQVASLSDSMLAEVNIFDDTDISLFSRKDRPEIASKLLRIMDGAYKTKARVFILTTNENVGTVDAAFLRPGRFSYVINIKEPDYDKRLQFIDSWKLKVSNPTKLAKDSDGFSFADLAMIKNLLADQYIKDKKIDQEAAMKEWRHRQETEKKYLIGFGGRNA